MNNDEVWSELKRLKFEDFLWVIFIVLAILNIAGDHNEINYIKTNENKYKNRSNDLFEFTIIVTIFIYIYFISRNYKFYKKAAYENKKLCFIKLLGSSLLLAGAICLLYFQDKQKNFVGSPAL